MSSLKVDDDIELRLFDERNAAEILKLVEENYERLHPFLHWVTKDFSLETALDFIRRNRKSVDEKTGQAFGIFRKEKLAGVIGFVVFNWSSRRAEVGYWIDKNHEGQGIVAASCKTLINYAFGELGMNRVEIHCATENTRSRRIPERLNFQLEGVLRQSEWRHTRFYDMAIYSLLAEEWETSEK